MHKTLAVQWLRLWTSNEGAQVGSLVRELRSHMPCGPAKKIKIKLKITILIIKKDPNRENKRFTDFSPLKIALLTPLRKYVLAS